MEVIQSSDFYKGIGFYKRTIKEIKEANRQFVILRNKHMDIIKEKEELQKSYEELQKKYDSLLSYNNKMRDDSIKRINDTFELYKKEHTKNNIFSKYISDIKNKYNIIEEEEETDEIGILKHEYIKSHSWNGYIHGNGNRCKGLCKGWDGKSDYCECGKTKREWVIIKTDEDKKYVLPVTIDINFDN